MKLKFIIVGLVLLMVGGSVLVIIKQPRRPRENVVPTEEQLPTAISNYSKTFKLNTNPPLWNAPNNGISTTN